MKRFLAIFLVSMFLILPVLAGWEEDANIGNVKFTVGKAETAPVLGEFDTSKYTKLEPSAGDMSYAWTDNFDEAESWAKGLSYEAYVSYDANNIYTLIISDASHYFCDLEDEDAGVWEKSCVQISASTAAAEGTERLEYGIYRNSDNGGLGGVVWAQGSDAGYGKAEFTPKAGENYTIALKDGKLYYECITPVNTFLDKDTVAEGDIISFSIVIAQASADETGHVHTQIASGCTGNGKTAENFMRLTLGAVIAPPIIDLPTEELPAVDVTEPQIITPPPVSPQTGNTGIIVFAGILIIAAASILILKTKYSA